MGFAYEHSRRSAKDGTCSGKGAVGSARVLKAAKRALGEVRARKRRRQDTAQESRDGDSIGTAGNPSSLSIDGGGLLYYLEKCANVQARIMFPNE